MSSKIALVSNTSWSIYNFRLGLIRALKSEGYDVIVIAPKDNFTAKLIAENVQVETIEIHNYGINPFKELNIISQLKSIYKRTKPDLIFHYTIKPNIYGSIAANQIGIPSIAITTGLGHLFDFKNFFVRMITLGLYKRAARLSKEVWFLNDNDKDVFVYKGIVDRSKVKVIKGEGIDTKWFRAKREKQFLGDIKFLFAGRLIWDKGVLEFVEAAKKIKEKYSNVQFELLGFIDQSNPNSVPYQKITDWQNAKIINYLGETTDVRPFINSAHCLVFPSFYREGVSRILMEAASMETPIITTDNVGCRDIVENGRNGFLTQPKNVDDLVSKIEQFLELNSEDMKVMGKLGRQKMLREFAEEKIVSEYLKTVEKYIPKSSSKTFQNA